jgi:hypothetical protein
MRESALSLFPGDISKLSVDDQLKLSRARYAWDHRAETCPEDHKFDDGSVSPINWATWFAIVYGQTLYDFQRQLQLRPLKGRKQRQHAA